MAYTPVPTHLILRSQRAQRRRDPTAAATRATTAAATRATTAAAAAPPLPPPPPQQQQSTQSTPYSSPMLEPMPLRGVPSWSSLFGDAYSQASMSASPTPAGPAPMPTPQDFSSPFPATWICASSPCPPSPSARGVTPLVEGGRGRKRKFGVDGDDTEGSKQNAAEGAKQQEGKKDDDQQKHYRFVVVTPAMMESFCEKARGSDRREMDALEGMLNDVKSEQ